MSLFIICLYHSVPAGRVEMNADMCCNKEASLRHKPVVVAVENKLLNSSPHDPGHPLSIHSTPFTLDLTRWRLMTVRWRLGRWTQLRTGGILKFVPKANRKNRKRLKRGGQTVNENRS